jgi:hypothetical protein
LPEFGVKRWLPLLLILLLALPLAGFFQGWVQEVLLIELARTYWSLRLLVESLPQVGLWGSFLTIVLLVAVGSLGIGWKPEKRQPVQWTARESQIQTLARWIQHADEGEYFHWSLNQYLSTLLSEVLAHREHITPAAVRRRLRAGQIDLPPDVEVYLQTWRPGRSHLARRRFQWRTSRATASEPSLESVVRFLEEQMEGSYDSKH